MAGTNDLVGMLLGTSSRRPAGPPGSEALIQSVRSGVPIAKAERALRALHLSLEEASESLGLSTRTLHRRKAEGQRLDSVESEKILRLARVADAAATMLGDRDVAGEWLRTTNVALGGHTPLSLLDTDVGASSVLDVLLRLEHGVFS